MQDFDPMGTDEMPGFKDHNYHNELYGPAEAQYFRVMLNEDTRARTRAPEHVRILGKRAERMVAAYLDSYQDELGGNAELNALNLLGTWVLNRLDEVHSTPRPPEIPKEPEVSDMPCVVTFSVVRGSRTHLHAALRIASGTYACKWWVLTGTHPVSAYLDWQELVTWITRENPAGRAIDLRVVSGWDPV